MNPDTKAMLAYLHTVIFNETLRTQDRVAAIAVYLDNHWRIEEAEAITVTSSSGNVFADLGFEDPEGELAKADVLRKTLGGIDPAQQAVS